MDMIGHNNKFVNFKTQKTLGNMEPFSADQLANWILLHFAKDNFTKIVFPLVRHQCNHVPARLRVIVVREANGTMAKRLHALILGLFTKSAEKKWQNFTKMGSGTAV